MDHQELSKMFYRDPSANRQQNLEQIYSARFNAESTFRLGFETPAGELFIATPTELSLLNDAVFCAEREIASSLLSMPPEAAQAVLRGLVLDEVVSNNAIEDIRSTRRQVRDALEAPETAPRSLKRFRELATLYLDIIDEATPTVTSLEMIREIYDEVTSGEIPPEKQPDGRLFRAQGVDIVQSGVKVVHHGLEPESRVCDALENMMELSHNDQVPPLYGAFAAHYLFEYIHPFYDGNGRTGRYLLSRALSDILSPATALSLSRIIAENRADYYQAFKTTEKPLNKGELTFFVCTMLELIREAQTQLTERLAESASIFHRIDAQTKTIAAAEALKEKDAAVVSLLMQRMAFGLYDDAPLSVIADRLHIKEQMARKHLARLEDRGVVAKARKRNPVTFKLTEEFRARYGIETDSDL